MINTNKYLYYHIIFKTLKTIYNKLSIYQKKAALHNKRIIRIDIYIEKYENQKYLIINEDDIKRIYDLILDINLFYWNRYYSNIFIIINKINIIKLN
jgi:hypothetical protein